MLADEAGIGNARLNRPTEVVAHPQLVERQRWRPVESPNGPVDSLLPPPIISGYDPPMGAVPALGEHTAAILAELGLPGADPGPLGGA
jgi:crotonobetainyl-CoA:carnitine CoA-transferase CaiB-like acyl-CoA transferase